MGLHMFMYDVRYGGQKEKFLNITWMYNMVMGRKKCYWAPLLQHAIMTQHCDGQKEILLNITWMYNMVMGRKKYF